MEPFYDPQVHYEQCIQEVKSLSAKVEELEEFKRTSGPKNPNLRYELQQCKSRNYTLETHLHHLHEHVDRLLFQRKDLESVVSGFKHQVRQLKKENIELRGRISALEEENITLQSEVEGLKTKLSRLIDNEIKSLLQDSQNKSEEIKSVVDDNKKKSEQLDLLLNDRYRFQENKERADIFHIYMKLVSSRMSKRVKSIYIDPFKIIKDYIGEFKNDSPEKNAQNAVYGEFMFYSNEFLEIVRLDLGPNIQLDNFISIYELKNTRNSDSHYSKEDDSRDVKITRLEATNIKLTPNEAGMKLIIKFLLAREGVHQ